ncbi:uncharacterized protein LOC122004365 [Zingiber officinale]|uniref:uncharacterized protein LOC122004365 n=1 Tax=Zingiber officinale TaxID=94328 RepID=UPI001C4BCFE1|nr:uncharacterized protein LOC122004365 [Zingiber officinale]
MDGDFFWSLIRKPPRDCDHMLKKANEYINVEDAQAARRKETMSEPSTSVEQRPPISHQPPRGPRAEGARLHQEARPHAVQHVVAERPKSKGKGSGIRILLISPQEERMQLFVQLDYWATNNEVEYEALLAGLQAARHVGAIRVLIHSDSQLAAQQLMGTFEISNTHLKLYVEAFKKLKANFQEVTIQKIPRAENQSADELAKLASSLSPIVLAQPTE